MRALDHGRNFSFTALMANLTDTARSRARSLRKDDTRAEQILWEALRNRRLGGFKFVRQLPIGPYVVDFACRERKLIVEVDGATHGSNEEVQRDNRRSAYLDAAGWRIHRCWNDDVYINLNGVCDSILIALEVPD
jgi:very-short-patch-repair endonuclease